MKWFDANKAPCRLHGLLDDYTRVPRELHAKLNSSAQLTSDFSAGGRVRFATDSKTVSVKIKLDSFEAIGALPAAGIGGSSIFCDGKYLGTFAPASFGVTEYEFTVDNLGREIMLMLPVYSKVISCRIGLEDDAEVSAPSSYKITTPVVFYGSSITNGAAVSSPENTYPHRLSETFGFDYINLGFGGGCRGEREMAEYIAGFEMTMLVMAYDHNAINAEELEERHNAFFEIIREKHPELPVLIMSKPDFANDPVNNAKRRDVVYSTYSRAQAKGDENVYFLDGSWMYGDLRIPDATVDGIHPKDGTFVRFAQVLAPIFKEILKTRL